MLAPRAVAGDRAGLLRRLQPLGDRRDARRAARHHQGADATRAGEDQGDPRGGDRRRRMSRGRTCEPRSHRARRPTSATATTSPPYALGALEERRGRRARTTISPTARRAALQLRWLEPAVDLLPRSVEQLEPPAGLRERLMATVRAEARDRLGAGRGRGAEATARLGSPDPAAGDRGGRRRASWSSGGAAGYLLHEPGRVELGRSRPSRRRRAPAGARRRRSSARTDRRSCHVARCRPCPATTSTRSWVERDGSARALEPVRPAPGPDRRGRGPGAAGRRRRRARHREPRGGSLQPTSRPLLRAIWTEPAPARNGRPSRFRRHGRLLPPPGPGDERRLLQLRATDLPRLHDRHPGGHALPGMRAASAPRCAASAAACGRARRRRPTR